MCFFKYPFRQFIFPFFIVLSTYLYISGEEIGREDFMTLTEFMIRELIPKIGRRSNFYSKFTNFKENQVSKIKG